MFVRGEIEERKGNGKENCKVAQAQVMGFTRIDKCSGLSSMDTINFIPELQTSSYEVELRISVQWRLHSGKENIACLLPNLSPSPRTWSLWWTPDRGFPWLKLRTLFS